MVDQLADRMKREWNSLVNDSAPTENPRTLTRKLSEQQQQQQKPSSDYLDRTLLSPLRASRRLPNQQSTENSYDTDGALASSSRVSRRHPTSSNYEHLVSPRLHMRRALTAQASKPVAPIPLQQRMSTHRPHLRPNDSHDDKDEDPLNNEDYPRRHLRLSHRIQQSSMPSGNSTIRAARLPLPAFNSIGPVPSPSPFRLIFMRHGERANQALGPDWYQRAFPNNTYRQYDRNLPTVLPRRRFDQHYEFDVPLTVRGLKSARLTGRAMAGQHMVADVCLSSTALRCIQTCERILTGMERRDRIPIRVEPGLFECPHANQRIVESFMTTKELAENRYNIKAEYKPLISRVDAPETLDEYFERSAAVMQGIINRYGGHGGTVLIVSHAPGLLALSDATKGTRPNPETFYRQVATYPPLAVVIADFDGSRWKFSEQPFNLLPT